MNLDVDSALTFLGFVEERHRIWERRQAGEKGPWTTDPILASRKFTSVFRVLDPGSQYVFGLDDPTSPLDTLLRLFLYRHTGRTEVWDHLLGDLGEYPTATNLPDVLESWKGYRASTGKPVFTGAYLVYPQSAVKGTDKLDSIIDLTHRMADGGEFQSFLEADTQADKYAVLRRNRGVADFMSYQILTDWGYTSHSTGDYEDEFVVLGPGARRGAQALLGTNPGKLNDVHLWAVEAIRSSPGRPEIEVYRDRHGSVSRLPSYSDTQNSLCEYSKYVRYMGKPDKNPKPYSPAHPGPQPIPVFPRHWGI